MKTHLKLMFLAIGFLFSTISSAQTVESETKSNCTIAPTLSLKLNLIVSNPPEESVSPIKTETPFERMKRVAKQLNEKKQTVDCTFVARIEDASVDLTAKDPEKDTTKINSALFVNLNFQTNCLSEFHKYYQKKIIGQKWNGTNVRVYHESPIPEPVIGAVTVGN